MKLVIVMKDKKNKSLQILRKYENNSRIDGFAGPMLLSLITLVYGIIFLVIVK